MSAKDEPENLPPEYCWLCDHSEEIRKDFLDLRQVIPAVAQLKTVLEKVEATTSRISVALAGDIDSNSKGIIPKVLDLEIKVKTLEEIELVRLKAELELLKEFKWRLVGIAFGISALVTVLGAILSKINWKAIL